MVNKSRNKEYFFISFYLWRILSKYYIVALFGLAFILTGFFYSFNPPRHLVPFLEETASSSNHQVREHSVLNIKYQKGKEYGNLKFVLLWSPKYYAPFYSSKDGNEVFITNKCPSTSCHVTANRNLFGKDVTPFDAIVFNGRNIYDQNNDLPKARSAHQKYVFFNMESADNYPMCSSGWDGFFNWTATYRLDSDIPFPYIQIKNQKGEVVGPQQNMQWLDYAGSETFDYSKNKTKAVAWFVSNCNSRSDRMLVARGLAEALKKYGWSVDIYGSCGTLLCPRFNQRYDCGRVLERDYFFYLSFENSFSEDYVTEKLLTALHHNVVPIVLGGADYTRFLPPGSYLNAANTSSEDLATTIDKLIRSPSDYNGFFRWNTMYRYRDPSTTDSVCALCAALHSDTFRTPSSHTHFRRWWNPDFEKRCAESLFGSKWF